MSTSKRKAALTVTQWQELLHGASQLSNEEKTIVKLLAEGKSQAAIGQQLGMHRSVVWRKAKEIAAKRKPTE